MGNTPRLDRHLPTSPCRPCACSSLTSTTTDHDRHRTPRLTMSTSKVAFTIRRPTSVSRADPGNDSTPEPNFKVPALPKRLATSSNGGSSHGSPAPSPAPRRRQPHAQDEDSSDEEDEEAEELVTGFDQFGVQRCVPLSLPLPSRERSRSSQQPLHMSIILSAHMKTGSTKSARHPKAHSSSLP